MAAAMINAAVAKALFETQLETLENFKAFLATKDDVDMEFMDELITGFKNTLEAPKALATGKGGKKGSKKGAKKGGDDGAEAGSDAGSEKKKRAPSAYTLYVKHKMHLLKTEDPEIKSGKDLMSKAVAAWGELSEDVKTGFKAAYKEDPTLSAEDLYNKVFNA